VRKNNNVADMTVYLPIDSASNAKKFINIIHPEMVFFIKYEFWPNYLNELHKQQIKTYLISGVFRKNQLFFKWYGNFFREALQTFDYFFVQNESSKNLIKSIGLTNVQISGDTRFDRVAAILEQDNSLKYIEEFKYNSIKNEVLTTIVIGSSWPKDEDLLIQYINQSTHVKFIIAPHNIKTEQIKNLKNAINKKSILYSEIIINNGLVLSDYDVFIVDTIGLLTKIYSYADIAYVGGGFGNPGVHNILEPATFGIPIVIGSNFKHFAEATALVNLGGCVAIDNEIELKNTFDSLIQNEDERLEKGHICSTFVQMNKGATNKILNYFR
jgi:3-deoxy-D-manno-octulosonic-acid transferase